MIRCTCGTPMTRYEDKYGVQYRCLSCGAKYDEQTDRIVGSLPRSIKVRRRA